MFFKSRYKQCSTQNSLFTCCTSYLIKYSPFFLLSPISKRRQKNWKRNWREFQAKDHLIYVWRVGFCLLLFWGIFCCCCCWFGVFINTVSRDINCLQSPEDARQGRLVLVLHGIPYALLLFSGSCTRVWPGQQLWFGQMHLPGEGEGC